MVNLGGDWMRLGSMPQSTLREAWHQTKTRSTNIAKHKTVGAQSGQGFTGLKVMI